jgi:glycosyltransferase involved in cell wall biosynthesis
MLIHQLCRDCWSQAVHPLIQPLGWFAEKIMHKPYIKASQSGKLGAVVTASKSTLRDLLELGYSDHAIRIIYNGVDWDFYKDCLTSNSGEKRSMVLYFGRITRYKRIEDLLMAWKIVQSHRQDINLVIAGRPDPKYLNRLKRLASKLSLERITFKLNVPKKIKR